MQVGICQHSSAFIEVGYGYIQHSTGTRFNTCVGGKLNLFPTGVQFGEQVGDPSVDLQGHPLVKPMLWISTSSTSFKLVLL